MGELRDRKKKKKEREIVDVQVFCVHSIENERVWPSLCSKTTHGSITVYRQV